MAEPTPHLFRPAVEELTPYQPGKPVEDVQRELGLERIVKLASNEGPFGPLPAARRAIERSVDELNRYPDGGAYRLRAALAERHDVRFEQVALGAGADGVAEYLKAGHRVVVLRTFSKIFGLAGLRVGYALAPPAVVTALGKVRRAFDITTPAQEAALASLGDPEEIERRRLENSVQRTEVERILREHGLEPAGPAVANFLYCDLGEDSRPLFEQLLREGVIVRPTHGFGGPTAIRVTVGTAVENAFLADALDRVPATAARAG